MLLGVLCEETMRINQARDAARRWVIEEASALSGFSGAYTSGSTNWLSDDSNLTATSDLEALSKRPGDHRQPPINVHHGGHKGTRRIKSRLSSLCSSVPSVVRNFLAIPHNSLSPPESSSPDLESNIVKVMEES
jgi:hypothetical protein